MRRDSTDHRAGLRQDRRLRRGRRGHGVNRLDLRGGEIGGQLVGTGQISRQFGGAGPFGGQFGRAEIGRMGELSRQRRGHEAVGRKAVTDGEILGLLQGLAGHGRHLDRISRHRIGGREIEGQILDPVGGQPLQRLAQGDISAAGDQRQGQIGIQDLVLGDHQRQPRRIGRAQGLHKAAQGAAKVAVEIGPAQLSPSAILTA